MKTSYEEEQVDKEMIVARFYIKQGKYTAAALRLEYMASMYKASKRVPEALALISAAYMALDKPEDTKLVLRVLEKSFATSPWTGKARQNMALWESDQDLGRVLKNLGF